MISRLFASYPRPFALLLTAALTSWAVQGRSEPEVPPIQSDTPAFQALASEQRLALSSQPSEKFQSLIDDFLAFRTAAAELISARFADRFTEEEQAILSAALLEYGEGDSGLASRGSPVFHSFYGHWRGQWFQDGAWTWYDHTWGKPVSEGELVVQYVEIGEWDGTQRVNAIPAINTYHPATGRIAGAVDVSKSIADGTVAPHWGIYIDDKTLIWIARFGPRDERPYYSIYFEQILERNPTQYRIRGIGFHWDLSGGTRRMVDPHWKEGRYWRARDLEADPELSAREGATEKTAP